MYKRINNWNKKQTDKRGNQEKSWSLIKIKINSPWARLTQWRQRERERLEMKKDDINTEF